MARACLLAVPSRLCKKHHQCALQFLYITLWQEYTLCIPFFCTDHSPRFCHPWLENYEKPCVQIQKQIATVCNNVTKIFKYFVDIVKNKSTNNGRYFISLNVFRMIKRSVYMIECFTNTGQSMPTKATCLSTSYCTRATHSSTSSCVTFGTLQVAADLPGNPLFSVICACSQNYENNGTDKSAATQRSKVSHYSSPLTIVRAVLESCDIMCMSLLERLVEK